MGSLILVAIIAAAVLTFLGIARKARRDVDRRWQERVGSQLPKQHRHHVD